MIFYAMVAFKVKTLHEKLVSILYRSLFPTSLILKDTNERRIYINHKSITRTSMYNWTKNTDNIFICIWASTIGKMNYKAPGDEGTVDIIKAAGPIGMQRMYTIMTKWYQMIGRMNWWYQYVWKEKFCHNYRSTIFPLLTKFVEVFRKKTTKL
jgi:hypothetical protein